MPSDRCVNLRSADAAPPAPAPIGLFDSGIGGLGVLLATRELLPRHPLLYYADEANFPYGPRPAAAVIDLASAASERLIALGARLIVVACNTASTAALPALRATFDIPFVGMVPAVKPASAATRSGRVALLATEGTVQTAALADLVHRFAAEIDVLFLPAPGLADRVEHGDLDGPATCALLERYLAPARDAGVDVVVLGCTHYVFLRPAVERIMGAGVTVIDTGAAVARQVARVLAERGLLTQADEDGASTGPIHYLTSGDPARLARLLDRLRTAGVPVPGGRVSADRRAMLSGHSVHVNGPGSGAAAGAGDEELL